MTALDAVHAEIERRERHVAELRATAEHLERLLGAGVMTPGEAREAEALPPAAPLQLEAPAPTPGRAAAARPHPPKPRASASADAQRERRDKVLHAVLTMGSCTRSRITERTGLPDTTVRTVLQALVKDETVIATGQTKSRRYSAGEKSASAGAAKVKTGAQRVAAEMDLGVARVKLRDRIATAVKADSGKLTGEQIAQSLNEDSDLVAEQLQWMAARNQVVIENGHVWRGQRCPR